MRHARLPALCRGHRRGHAAQPLRAGRAATIAELAELLHKPVLPLDPAFGIEPATRRVAFIREAECIGCTKCLQACPVDAIMGAAKLMHTVIVDECTGCDLCVAPCPVDCIEMHDLPKITDRSEQQARANHYRARFEARNARLAREKAERDAPVITPPLVETAIKSGVATSGIATPGDDKSRVIAAALARSNLKKAERKLAEAEANGGDTAALQAEVEKLRREAAGFEQK